MEELPAAGTAPTSHPCLFRLFSRCAFYFRQRRASPNKCGADKKCRLDSPGGRCPVTTTGTARIAARPAALSTSSPGPSLPSLGTTHADQRRGQDTVLKAANAVAPQGLPSREAPIHQQKLARTTPKTNQATATFGFQTQTTWCEGLRLGCPLPSPHRCRFRTRCAGGDERGHHLPHTPARDSTRQGEAACERLGVTSTLSLVPKTSMLKLIYPCLSSTAFL